MDDRRNGSRPAGDLESEARRRAEEAERRWKDTETALRARWDQREAALRDAGSGKQEEGLEEARRELDRAQATQRAHQEAIHERLQRLEQLTAELKQSGAVEPRQRIRDRIARWWRGLTRRGRRAD
ncbi:MAG: hypothetical protein HY331_06005 [Chloroflexi bacterium]|nr:hypothetical protein [Chloroflexota bacterium]